MSAYIPVATASQMTVSPLSSRQNLFMVLRLILVLLLFLSNNAYAALEVNLDSADSIRHAARQVAYDMMTFYEGNETGQIPGVLPGPPPKGPYYWWQGGALWGALIQYWAYTGDNTYNPQVMEGMLFQVGPNKDYQHENWTLSLGNDDQAFWGMSAMLAAETVFPNPSMKEYGIDMQWLSLAQAVFNTQAAPSRHDGTCGGGLRWQIPISNRGYDYKNSISNGCFFNMGARLARYTSNDTYAAWARKTWDWMEKVGFLDKNTYFIYDGGHVYNDCKPPNRAQFSYNAAVFLEGAAYMYNYTAGLSGSTISGEAQVWAQRVQRLLDALQYVFFSDHYGVAADQRGRQRKAGIAFEVACEMGMTCTTDMLSFKGYVLRWMTTTLQMAPFTRAQIRPLLRASAAAAVRTCTGGSNGRMCGFRWANPGTFTDVPGVGAGQQMNVLAALSCCLATLDTEHPPAAVTNSSGGTSQGNPSAGTGGRKTSPPPLPHIAAHDKVGAAFITVASCLLVIGIALSLSCEIGELPIARRMNKATGRARVC